MASMKEIAVKAGVSVATVSRVFNGADNVSEKNREKVLRSLTEAGYHMNFQARNLRTSKTGRLIALVPTMRNPIFADLIEGMCEEAKKLNLSLLIASIEYDHHNAVKYTSMLEEHQADGIVFISKSFSDKILDSIRGRFPFVLCNEMQLDSDSPSISIDNYSAAYEATEYLIRSGCRHIGYISGHRSSPSTNMRVNGYRDALIKNGQSFSEGNIIFGMNSSLSEYPTIRAFLEKNDFDGFLVNSDIKAALTLRYLLEEQKMNPSDIHLVSFDGSYVSEMFVPSISSIIQPMREIGIAAIDCISAQIDKRKFKAHQTIPYSFIKRST